MSSGFDRKSPDDIGINVGTGKELTICQLSKMIEDLVPASEKNLNL